MNLPIKLVDLVTLLFICFLVVVIVFIILQRNIKRFKIRNVKDPHFLTCKSIPKELKDAIHRKHAMSHIYTEPTNLFSSNYTNLKEDKAVSFITRMKAFETSRNLEYALCDFGYRRPINTKFEDFIDSLTKFTDEALPVSLLKEFHVLYVWAMIDPMKFELEQLRKINKLINKTIEQLAANKKPLHDTIIQHKLDLSDDGDYDFTRKPPTRTFTITRKHKENSKEVKFSQGDGNAGPSSEPESKSHAKGHGSATTTTTGEYSHSRGGSNKLSQLARNVFSRKSNSEKLLNSSSASSVSKENTAKLKEKLLRTTGSTSSNENTTNNANKNNNNNNNSNGNNNKYVEMQDVSFNSSNQSRSATLDTIKTASPNLSDRDEDAANTTNRWSMTNDSIKGFDSENEEIPLVTTKKSTNHQKKKSGHSIVTVIPNTAASSGGGGSGLASTAKSKQVRLMNEHEAQQARKVSTSSPVTTIKTPEMGAENEGFNETNF